MERGYVKLWRKTLDSGLLQNAAVLQVFIYLLLNATHKRTRLLKDTTPVTLEAGQVLSGRKKIAQECKLSERNVRTALKVLETMEIVTIKATNKYSIVSFVNWESYQQEQPTSRPTERPTPDQQATSKRPAPDHIQEHKNIRTEEYKNPPLTPQGGNREGEGFAEPGIEFVELRQAYNDIRPEGPLDGFSEYKALKHTRLYPGNDKLICDFLQRKASGVWNPGYEIGLARYLKTRAWEAPIVPRPTRLTLQEERDKRELEKFLNDEPTYSESRDGKDPF